MCKILKNSPTVSVTALPLTPIMDSTLSLAAKGMYAELVANGGIAEGNDDVSNTAIAELIEHGYIEEITESYNKGDV